MAGEDFEDELRRLLLLAMVSTRTDVRVFRLTLLQKCDKVGLILTRLPQGMMGNCDKSVVPAWRRRSSSPGEPTNPLVRGPNDLSPGTRREQ